MKYRPCGPANVRTVVCAVVKAKRSSSFDVTRDSEFLLRPVMRFEVLTFSPHIQSINITEKCDMYKRYLTAVSFKEYQHFQAE